MKKSTERCIHGSKHCMHVLFKINESEPACNLAPAHLQNKCVEASSPDLPILAGTPKTASFAGIYARLHAMDAETIEAAGKPRRRRAK
jgi:hypothetical protein